MPGRTLPDFRGTPIVAGDRVRKVERNCTCGAMEIEGCACGLTPREYYASVARRAKRTASRRLS